MYCMKIWANIGVFLLLGRTFDNFLQHGHEGETTVIGDFVMGVIQLDDFFHRLHLFTHGNHHDAADLQLLQ